jgi:rhodanese-related sulfurtransferase
LLIPSLSMNEFADAEADLTPAEVASRMAEGDLLLIDVREDYEWSAGRVPGARHIPIENIASQAPTLPKDRPIAFICLAGVRSAMVARAFRDAGYSAYNVIGGFTEWFGLGLPTEPDDAEVAPH